VWEADDVWKPFIEEMMKKHSVDARP